MPTLLKVHHYINRNSKHSKFIASITPLADRQVSRELFDSFEDVTKSGGVEIVEGDIGDARKLIEENILK
jgi:hypothetical protein